MSMSFRLEGIEISAGRRARIFVSVEAGGARGPVAYVLEHERYYGFGMDALVIVCSRARTLFWFWHGCSGHRMLSNMNVVLQPESKSQRFPTVAHTRRTCKRSGTYAYDCLGRACLEIDASRHSEHVDRCMKEIHLDAENIEEDLRISALQALRFGV